MIPAFVPMFHAKPTALVDILRDLSLTTNLQLCLDAGDSRSYDGSSQTWTDLSGGGYNFVRGSTTGSETSDPTFNGIAGRQTGNEYFSLDGGDYFTLGQSNPSWIEAIHKDSAVVSIAVWKYANGITDSTKNFGITFDYGTGTGFGFGNAANNLGLNVEFSVYNGASLVLLFDSTNVITNNAWNFVSISFDEASGTATMRINGNSESFTGKTYSSPSAGASGATLQIGAAGGGLNPDTAGGRTAKLAMWNRALSATELSNLFSATRGAYGV